MDWEKISKILRTQNWIILLILGSASFFLMSSTFTLGIILGGLIIIANFNVFQHTIRSAFSSDGVMRANNMSIIAKYYFRLLALGLIIFFLITNGWVDPVGLAVGLSTVVISIVSFGIGRVRKSFTGETP